MENKPTLSLLTGKSPSQQTWRTFFLHLFRGQTEPQTAKALLLLLAKKGEEAQEISACVQVVRRLEPPRRVALPYLVDVCGTGGDGMKTFNISTVTSFVVAAAGAYVAKHGNRAVSSRAGSSDLIEALGVRLELPAPRMFEALRRYHWAYFHAPLYHPVFARIQPLRKELGIPTLFNALGPLLNPIELRYQMLGVSNPSWLAPVAEALKTLGRDRAAAYRSEDGLDELSTTGPSDIFYLEKRTMRKLRLDPKKFGFSRAKLRDYQGGDPETNREIALGILEDRIRGPQQDVVVLNSGFALWLTGIASTLREGIQKSRWVLRGGRALDLLEALRRWSE